MCDSVTASVSIIKQKYDYKRFIFGTSSVLDSTRVRVLRIKCQRSELWEYMYQMQKESLAQVDSKPVDEQFGNSVNVNRCHVGLGETEYIHYVYTTGGTILTYR